VVYYRYINILNLQFLYNVIIKTKLDVQLPMQSVRIPTNVLSSNPAQSIQHHVIKVVSDCQSVVFSGYSGFLHQ